jgi:16S rRNA processing protein RimM
VAQSRELGIQKQTRSSHLDSGSGSVAPSRNDKVLVAKFGAPHGVRGDVKLWSFTEDPLAIAAYGPLESADGRTFEIESLRPAKDFLVARVAGVNDRSAAEALRNVELYVARERLSAIEDEETWYISDLIGLAAQTPDGAQVGTVVAVHNFGAGDVIEIAPADGGPTIMLPFTESAVPEVNVKADRVVVVLPSEGDDVARIGPDDLS